MMKIRDPTNGPFRTACVSSEDLGAAVPHAGISKGGHLESLPWSRKSWKRIYFLRKQPIGCHSRRVCLAFFRNSEHIRLVIDRLPTRNFTSIRFQVAQIPCSLPSKKFQGEPSEIATPRKPS